MIKSEPSPSYSEKQYASGEKNCTARQTTVMGRSATSRVQIESMREAYSPPLLSIRYGHSMQIRRFRKELGEVNVRNTREPGSPFP